MIYLIQGVQEKLCFFTIHCNPSLAYIAVKETFKALNAMRVYSHSYWLYNQYQLTAGEGEVENFREFLERIFDEHPVAATTSTPIIPNTVAYM